ncbi:nuclear transport factor 2 family protein [Mycolicibacterium sphagni]|uniref:Nuclear transport factor 2 family protein n=1 Tax=Mycolicibacterium sphagni TaxID=1786 RepID=A0ABX2JW66_9MYCO|nr:nuclear transport factor 2 family protein [Mycolicibacterium sphagni]NTY58275.1 nuclear transport factor 2 family protein [Mycolicibacterium sphagni]
MTNDEQRQRNLAAVRAGIEGWGSGTSSPFPLLAEDATWEITGNSEAAGIYSSRAELMTRVIVPLATRMATPLIPVIRALYSDGDTVIALFDAEGMARDGRPYRNTYAWFLQFSGDRIVKGTAFYDSIAFNDLWRRVTPMLD